MRGKEGDKEGDREGDTEGRYVHESVRTYNKDRACMYRRRKKSELNLHSLTATLNGGMQSPYHIKVATMLPLEPLSAQYMYTLTHTLNPDSPHIPKASKTIYPCIAGCCIHSIDSHIARMYTPCLSLSLSPPPSRA